MASLRKTQRTSSQASTSKTEGFSLKNEIASLALKQVTLKTEDGFFMTVAKLNQLEERLATIMENGKTSQSPTTLIALQEQLNQMVVRAERAELQVAAAQAKSEAVQHDMLGVTKALEAQKMASNQEKVLLNAEKDSLKKELDQLTKVQKAQKHIAADPEVVAERAKQITRLQNDLSVINAKYTAENAKVSNLISEKQKLQADLDLQLALAKRMGKAMITDSKLVSLEPEPLKPLVINEIDDSAILKRVFSTESIKILEKAAEARRTNLREYAHNLLEFAARTDPRNYIGYKTYCKVIFEKVKSTSADKRKKYLPIVDKLFCSMATRTGPKLKEVKEEFSNFFSFDEKKRPTPLPKDSKSKRGWWDAIKFDCWTFKIMAKLKVRIWWKESFLPLFAFTRKMTPFSFKGWWSSP